MPMIRHLQWVLSSPDPLQHFSWLMFCIVAVVYSFMTFTGVAWKQGALVFSERNARSPITVLSIHARFLLMLLVVLWLVSVGFRGLPKWMMDTITLRGASVSYCDLSFVMFMAVLLLIEGRLIFVVAEDQDDSEADHPK